MFTAHFFFEWLAYIVGFSFYRRLRQKTDDPINQDQRQWLIIAAAFGALLGSRGLDVIEHLNLFEHTNNTWLFIISSKTIVGALLGGTISVEIAKKFLRIKQSTGDLFVFPLMLAMMIGRIGCLLDGLHDGTIGLPTQLPWGINFGDGITRHPTSLYEIIFLMVLWAALLLIKNRRQLGNGDLFKLFMLSYLCYRFLVAFIEPIYHLFFGLSAIQLACVVGIIYFSPIISVFWRQPTHAHS